MAPNRGHWRVGLDGQRRRAFGAAPLPPGAERRHRVVQWLGHENAWQRETAQRLLVEKHGEYVEKNGVAAATVGELPDTGALLNLHLQAVMQGIIWKHIALIEEGDRPRGDRRTRHPRRGE